MKSFRPGSFLGNILSNSASSILVIGSQLLITVILARAWGETDFGKFSLASALIFCLELVADFGLRMWAVQALATADDPFSLMKRIYISRGMLAIMALGAAALTPFKSLSLGERAICGLVAITQPLVDPALWLFRAKEKLHVESLIVAIWRMVTFFAFAIVALLGHGFLLLLLAWLILNLLRWIGTVSIREYRNLIKPLPVSFRVNFRDCVLLLRDAFPFGVCILLAQVSHRVPLFLVERLGAIQDLSLFGLGSRLLYAFSFVTSSITLTTFPSFIRAHRAANSAEAMELFRRGLQYLSWIMFSIALGGVPASRVLMVPIFGQQYEPVARLMALLLPISLLMSLNYYLGYLMANIEPRRLEIATSLIGVAVIVVFVLATPRMNIEISVTLGWFVSELMKFFLRSWILSQRSGYRGLWFLRLTGMISVNAGLSLAGFWL